MRTLGESLTRQGGALSGRYLGTLHPNARGHALIAARIYRSLWASLYPGRPAPPTCRRRWQS